MTTGNTEELLTLGDICNALSAGPLLISGDIVKTAFARIHGDSGVNHLDLALGLQESHLLRSISERAHYGYDPGIPWFWNGSFFSPPRELKGCRDMYGKEIDDLDTYDKVISEAENIGERYAKESTLGKGYPFHALHELVQNHSRPSLEEVRAAVSQTTLSQYANFALRRNGFPVRLVSANVAALETLDHPIPTLRIPLFTEGVSFTSARVSSFLPLEGKGIDFIPSRVYDTEMVYALFNPHPERSTFKHVELLCDKDYQTTAPPIPKRQGWFRRKKADTKITQNQRDLFLGRRAEERLFQTSLPYAAFFYEVDDDKTDERLHDDRLWQDIRQRIEQYHQDHPDELVQQGHVIRHCKVSYYNGNDGLNPWPSRLFVQMDDNTTLVIKPYCSEIIYNLQQRCRGLAVVDTFIPSPIEDTPVACDVISGRTMKAQGLTYKSDLEALREGLTKRGVA
ncbi:MAG TPA: hypothetical protein VJI15_03905 [Candidatus Nanoarchaeia archaeon]|nr:hypothetical protein [Candidatus Nanoarchaeia archaeon]